MFHAIICDHAFVDGNKRTGTMAAIFLLFAEGVLDSLHDAGSLRVRLLGQVALEAASGNLSVGEVAFWIRRIFERPSSEDEKAS